MGLIGSDNDILTSFAFLYGTNQNDNVSAESDTTTISKLKIIYLNFLNIILIKGHYLYLYQME